MVDPVELPVVDGSPPEAGEHVVDIVDEIIVPEYISTLTARVPEKDYSGVGKITE